MSLLKSDLEQLVCHCQKTENNSSQHKKFLSWEHLEEHFIKHLLF